MPRDGNDFHTYRLAAGTDPLDITRGSFGTKSEPGLIGYVRLPLNADPKYSLKRGWRILLELTGTNQGVLAFELIADVIVGRGNNGPDAPHLDLAILRAEELGVSRQHAMLRPTRSHLYVLDLGSTNGTTINGLELGQSQAHPLTSGDHLALGMLNMTVARMDRAPEPSPDEPPAPPTRDLQDGLEPASDTLKLNQNKTKEEDEEESGTEERSTDKLEREPQNGEELDNGSAVGAA